MLISIHSPKGGVGKTTLTLALADAFSKTKKTGQMLYKFKTCVVEFDFSPGDFASILDLDNSKNIINAIKFGAQGNIQNAGNFDALLGGYPDTHEQIGRESFNKLIKTLEDMYDVVVVDIQPGFIERSVDVIGCSDIVLLIAEDTLNVAARINGFLNWLDINNISKMENFYFIVNKKSKGEYVYLDKISYKLPTLFCIPQIKNLKGYKDKRFASFAEKVKEKILEICCKDAGDAAKEKKNKKGRWSMFELNRKDKRN